MSPPDRLTTAELEAKFGGKIGKKVRFVLTPERIYFRVEGDDHWTAAQE